MAVRAPRSFESSLRRLTALRRSAPREDASFSEARMRRNKTHAEATLAKASRYDATASAPPKSHPSLTAFLAHPPAPPPRRIRGFQRAAPTAPVHAPRGGVIRTPRSARSFAEIALVLTLVVRRVGADTATAGASLGFLIWVIVAAVGLTGHIASDAQFAAYVIDTGYQLLYLTGSGALLAAWRKQPAFVDPS